MDGSGSTILVFRTEGDFKRIVSGWGIKKIVFKKERDLSRM